MKYLLALLLLVALSCTENSRARQFGGTTIVDLPKGTKLVTATWKKADLWYLYRPMTESETPQTTTFQEQSNLGMMEGKVIFKETK